MKTYVSENNKIKLFNTDFLTNNSIIPDKAVDIVFADLPYGTTKAPWDRKLPLNDYIIENDKYIYKEDFFLNYFKGGARYDYTLYQWDNLKKDGVWTILDRLLKPNGVCLMFAQSPFDKELGESNIKNLKYEWIWEKTQATGSMNSKKMPMKAHENILVFYKKYNQYFPQKTEGHKPVNSYTKYLDTVNKTELYGKSKVELSGGGNTDRYPRSVIKFKSDKQKNKLNGTIFSTQKPLELIKYFLKTYGTEESTVLDFCMGSGTVPLGCQELNMKCYGIEINEDTFNLAVRRLQK